jgi:ectoine hydroxylase-related dioxygenase (phytanoyl-CoA dioxygenase family)
VQLTDEQVARFREDGYLVIGQLIGQETVEKLRIAYDEILEGKVVSPQDRMLGGATRQVLNPSEVHPVFDSNPAVDAGMEIMNQVFSDDCIRTYDTLIYKPPGHEHETPWHQDEAYKETPFAPGGQPIALGNAIQFWVALDDVDESTGCMHFIPGMHKGNLLEHRVFSGTPDEPTRELALVDPQRDLPLETTVAAPVPAGWATMHSAGTPHFTTSNTSKDRHRRAYIFNLAPVGLLAEILEAIQRAQAPVEE